jgi:hypothetical protein
MPKQEKNLDQIASVVGSVNIDQISSGSSQVNVSIGNFVDHDEVEFDDGELGSTEVETLFREIYNIISSPPRSNMSSEQREDMKYIVEGLQVQITRGNQNNKLIFHRFLQFLGDRAPEISKIVSDALFK